MSKKNTAEFTATFGPFPADGVFSLVDTLADAFDDESSADGPMVVGNKEEGTITVSFEFEATGAIQVDIPRAFDIMQRALWRHGVAGDASPTYDLPHMVVEQRMAFA